jgi:hypothetical protein
MPYSGSAQCMQGSPGYNESLSMHRRYGEILLSYTYRSSASCTGAQYACASLRYPTFGLRLAALRLAFSCSK